MLHPRYRIKKTSKYGVIEIDHAINDIIHSKEIHYNVYFDLNCEYSRNIVDKCIQRRSWCTIVHGLKDYTKSNSDVMMYQISDFENIDWELVMSNNRNGASSYLVRKGLSRKAQLSLQIRKYLSKHQNSCLRKSCPYTLIIETWNAFDEMKLDFGGGTFATFNTATTLNAPVRQRIDWCLEDIKEEFHHSDRVDWSWILKPSVTNKGANIIVAKDWNTILDHLEDVTDIREWVLQRYVDKPLLVNKHKFHLRVYVLCVGALKVYVFDQILMLLAAHSYKKDDLDDIYRHLTNTARSAEDINFDEKKYVKLLDDLPSYLLKQKQPHIHTINDANDAVANIRKQVHTITKDLYAAYENEYTIFSPMNNCFELYGLDFLVDESLDVHLLEVNPGPDFKQTGDRLKSVICALWEQTCAILLHPNIISNNTTSSNDHDENIQSKYHDYTLVYDKEWSASQLGSGGMKFN